MFFTHTIKLLHPLDRLHSASTLLTLVEHHHLTILHPLKSLMKLNSKSPHRIEEPSKVNSQLWAHPLKPDTEHNPVRSPFTMPPIGAITPSMAPQTKSPLRTSAQLPKAALWQQIQESQRKTRNQSKATIAVPASNIQDPKATSLADHRSSLDSINTSVTHHRRSTATTIACRDFGITSFVSTF